MIVLVVIRWMYIIIIMKRKIKLVAEIIKLIIKDKSVELKLAYLLLFLVLLSYYIVNLLLFIKS